jgi:hypothetical protein
MAFEGESMAPTGTQLHCCIVVSLGYPINKTNEHYFLYNMCKHEVSNLCSRTKLFDGIFLIARISYELEEFFVCKTIYATKICIAIITVQGSEIKV